MLNSNDLKEKIYSLVIEHHKLPKEIKGELCISNPSLYYYIKKLKGEGRISADFTFSRTISKKDKEDICYLLLHKGKTLKQVGSELRITTPKLRECVRELKNEGLIPQDFFTNSNLSTDKKEKIRYLAVEKKQTLKSISKELKVSSNTMVTYVKQLKEEGLIPKEFVFKKGGRQYFRRGPLSHEEKQQIRIMVLEKKYMAIEVAESLDVSLPTLSKYMNQLKEEGYIPQEFTFVRRKQN